MSDPRLAVLEAMIHRFKIIPSKTTLSGHHYRHCLTTQGPLTEKDERHALHISRLVDHLSDSVIVFPRLRLQGSPTGLVSRFRYPEADRDLVHRRLAGLSVLGSTRVRRDLLEIPIPAELQRLLPGGFVIRAFPTQFHHRTSDIAVTGPDKQMFNTELRNRRTHIHDVVSPADRKALTAAHAAGRTTFFVVPQSTIRFRREIAKHRGEAIDTQMYLVATDEAAELVTTNGWSCWPAHTPTGGIPTIADLITKAILSRYEGLQPRTNPGTERTVPSMIPTSGASREIRRLLQEHGHATDSVTVTGSAMRVAEARELHSLGVPTQKAAAEVIGCARSTLCSDFKREGIRSPWPHGGARPNAGRKSS